MASAPVFHMCQRSSGETRARSLTTWGGGGQMGGTAPPIDDRMPRWPDMTPGGVLRAGDWIGTFICALVSPLLCLHEQACICLFYLLPMCRCSSDLRRAGGMNIASFASAYVCFCQLDVF